MSNKFPAKIKMQSKSFRTSSSDTDLCSVHLSESAQEKRTNSYYDMLSNKMNIFLGLFIAWAFGPNLSETCSHGTCCMTYWWMIKLAIIVFLFSAYATAHATLVVYRRVLIETHQLKHLNATNTIVGKICRIIYGFVSTEKPVNAKT